MDKEGSHNIRPSHTPTSQVVYATSIHGHNIRHPCLRSTTLFPVMPSQCRLQLKALLQIFLPWLLLVCLWIAGAYGMKDQEIRDLR